MLNYGGATSSVNYMREYGLPSSSASFANGVASEVHGYSNPGSPNQVQREGEARHKHLSVNGSLRPEPERNGVDGAAIIDLTKSPLPTDGVPKPNPKRRKTDQKKGDEANVVSLSGTGFDQYYQSTSSQKQQQQQNVPQPPCDDKEGHYIVNVNENLTPRCEYLFEEEGSSKFCTNFHVF